MSTHSNIPANSQSEPATNGAAPPSSGLLKESLAIQIGEAILSGKLAPGEKIIERRWAREFGAAQVSVREALNILIAEGFVTKGHGRSARVLRLTDAAIIHTYQVRGALAGLAARIIVEQKLPVADLEAAMVELRLAVETNDVRTVLARFAGLAPWHYEPTTESLDRPPLPQWYAEAKFGIFVHWGLYSVPRWAPTAHSEQEFESLDYIPQNPYAEWCLNSMRLDGSP